MTPIRMSTINLMITWKFYSALGYVTLSPVPNSSVVGGIAANWVEMRADCFKLAVQRPICVPPQDWHVEEPHGECDLRAR
jgi:hypothetical protein